MALEFKLPDVGEGLHEAEIVRWLVNEGEAVKEDQPLVEVQTDKVTVEIPAPRAGTLLKRYGQEGEIVAVGAVIAVIGEAGEIVPGGDAGAAGEAGEPPQPAPAQPQPSQPRPAAAPDAPATPTASPANVAPAAVPAASAAPATQSGRRSLATPATRHLARRLGVDLRQVPPTGPGGRVTSDDVRRFAEAQAAGQSPAQPNAPAAITTVDEGSGTAMGAGAGAALTPAASATAAGGPAERIPLRGVRRAIAEAMVRSKRTAPHVTVMDEVQVEELVDLRARAREMAARRGIKLTYLPFIVKAAVVALREFPYLNAQVDDEKQEIVLLKNYNIGIAVDTEVGLFVPVVKEADRKSFYTVAQEIQDLSVRAREGKLTLDELRGGTFSVSNMGAVGAGTYFTPVINHPEVGILGVGAIAQKPVVRDGEIAVGRVLHLSLSFDHRVVDGAYGTRFLQRVMQLLANPTQLLMEA